jgi:hypothetical protein
MGQWGMGWSASLVLTDSEMYQGGTGQWESCVKLFSRMMGQRSM